MTENNRNPSAEGEYIPASVRKNKTMTRNNQICPVCGEEYNHYIDNGHRNGWPTKGEEGIATVKFEVCTPSDSDHMYVHTENVKTPMSGDGLADLQDANPSPFDQKVESIAVVLDEFPPMQILQAVQKLANDPDSIMESGDVLTTASNLSTDEELERKIGLSEKKQDNNQDKGDEVDS